MRSACIIVASAALAACSFDPSTTAAPLDGDGSPIIDDADAATSDASTATADAEPPCVLPFLIDDHFDNGDLGSVGGMSTGNGFTQESNTGGNGSSLEVGGQMLEIRSSSNMSGAAPAFGAASNTSFAFDAVNGMTVRLEVAAADTPIWNGIVLGLQTNQGSAGGSGPSLMLRVRGSTTRAFTVGMGTDATYDEPFGEKPYDEAELADGFVITWVLLADSWSYVAEGLLTSGAVISDSGNYGANEAPADMLDASAHLGVHIQGNTDDVEQRVLQVTRLSLMTGVCP